MVHDSANLYLEHGFKLAHNLEQSFTKPSACLENNGVNTRFECYVHQVDQEPHSESTGGTAAPAVAAFRILCASSRSGASFRVYKGAQQRLLWLPFHLPLHTHLSPELMKRKAAKATALFWHVCILRINSDDLLFFPFPLLPHHSTGALFFTLHHTRNLLQLLEFSLYQR
jgi:hypothetical protein